MNKKKQQLGMNPSTAAHRLRVDLLFDFVIKAGYNCYRCNKPLTRDTFSIEHKEPWLDSDDPVEKYFDLNNIAFSHLSCNCRASGWPKRMYNTPEEIRKAQREYNRKSRAKKSVCTKRRERQERYRRTGN
jgi:hypothetical protein